MIVFWRLVLVYYICAVFFYNQRFFAWRDRHTQIATWLQGAVFFLLAAGFCYPFLQLDWQLADLWPLPGWAAAALVSVVYAITNRLFVYRPDQTKNYTRTFLIHDVLALLGIFIISPLHMVYHSGNWVAEPVILFLVGILVVTKMFSVFIYMVEQDKYGRDCQTLDEKFVTMLMRLIFFLIVLLPGWRGLVWFLIWWWACQVARKTRLLDFSPFAFYFSIFGTVAVGFLVRYSWYWVR